MRSTNPVLRSIPGADADNGYQDGQTATLPGHAPEIDQQRPMTVDDVVTKTGITLAVIIAFAAANFGIFLTGNVQLGFILTIVGAIGGFSLTVSGWFTVGGADAGQLIFQAILGTIGVFIGMLVVYRRGAIRVTPRFNRILTGLIFGVAIMALGNFLLAIFTGISPLRDGGTLSIIFGVVCVVLAALSFLQDFDLADKLVRTGAPERAAWGVALGLAVTLVWLYTEILRLLSYVNDR